MVQTTRYWRILSLEDLNSIPPNGEHRFSFYKDLKLISMGPPSSGGICLAQMLHMMSPMILGLWGL